MGLQTLVHSPRLEKGRKRLGWGGKRPDCHLWSCHPLQAEDFHLPSPAQHTEHSKSLPSGPKAAQDLSGTTLTAILSILHSFPHFSFPAVTQTQAHSSSGPFLSPPPGLHSARPLYAQALTLLLHHSKFTSGEWHFLSSVPGTQYPRDISIPGCTKRKPSSFP